MQLKQSANSLPDCKTYKGLLHWQCWRLPHDQKQESNNAPIISEGLPQQGYPKAVAKASTSFLSARTSLHSLRPISKSFNFLPFSFWICKAIWRHLSRNSAIFLKSSSVHPLVVIAGVPMRTPPGDRAEASPCTAFLFNDIEAASHTFSTLDPVRPCGRKSQRIKWLSVPSLASLWPLAFSASASDFAFDTTRLEYSTNSGVLTSRSCAASAPI